MRDQDAGDCGEIKKDLTTLCDASGKKHFLIRIACRELESFYLGDLPAVEEGLRLNGIASQQRKSRYRDPDAVVNPSAELARLTKGAYQKIAGSRAISQYLDLTENKSCSFRMLVSGIQNLLTN